MPSHGVGPIPARIMLVGEAWGADEEREGQPFVGASGQELNRMLHEAGIMRSECFVTNLVNRRPPNNDIGAWIALKKKDVTKDHVRLRDKMVLPIVVEGYRQLYAEISAVNPNLIIPMGNWAMWATTGKTGIRNWRGSQLRLTGENGYELAVINSSPDGNAEAGLAPKVIPTFHPAAILRQWDWRAAGVSDLRRAARHAKDRIYNFPDQRFIVRPNFSQVIERLQMLLNYLDDCRTYGWNYIWLDVDIETGIKIKHLKCIGISWSKQDALCIPFVHKGWQDYWNEEEESWIVWYLYKVMTHPAALCRMQNGLFDCQYIHRMWHFVPNVGQDTMISQHAIFSDQPKALYYQASLYAENYVFWKEEGKGMEDAYTPQDENQGWVYNCKDCVYTREVGEVEQGVVDHLGLGEVHAFQQSLFHPVLRAMQRGVRVIPENRSKLAEEVQEQISVRQAFLNDVTGQELNVNSSKQMIDFFYHQLGQPPIMSRPKKGVPPHITCDDEALTKIATREPFLKPIVACIQDIRTLEIFLGNFILAKLDIDGRMRCSYNIGGSESGKSAPKTYRLSSSKNAFGTGTNLQNIPSEKSKSVGKSVARGHIAMLGDPYSLPNVRSLFGPDPGYTFFDQDLDRSDLQVVAWECNDALLKAALRQGVDIHLLNAFILVGKEPPPLEELVEGHAKYPDHRGPLKHIREFAKVFCHATNFGGGARTVAINTGRTIHEVERAQKIWFGAHPGIKHWHEDIKAQVLKRRYVENKFGYRWYIFDRIESIIPEAIAWIPQSTTSNVINKIWKNLYDHAPEIEVLLQVHDSLAGQFPTHMASSCLAKLKELSRIVVPYDDPLIIPTGVGTSTINWGLC